MNLYTQKIIEFLSHPELPFGTEEDVLILSDPGSLRERVGALLGDHPRVLGQDNTRDLEAGLAQVDWSFVAQEFRARVAVASGFFDADAQATAKDVS